MGAYANLVAPLDGRIDEVAIYKRALSQSERSWLYNYGTGRTYADVNPSYGNPGTTGLVSWWTMNESSGTRYDSKGTNHLSDNNTVGSTIGKQGGAAAEFVATNQEYLSIADNPSLSTGDIDFTLVANVYLNNNTGSFVIVNKSDDNHTVLEYRLVYNPGTGFRFRADPTTYVDSGAVSANTWHTVVGWHDSVNNTINIQVDNGVVNTVAYSGGGTDTSYRLTMGAYSYGAVYLDGRIDEVAFYKRILTAAERNWLYNNGNGRTYADLSTSPTNPGTTGLVSWWALNEDGGTRSDRHGTNHVVDNNTVTSVTGKQAAAAHFTLANSEYLNIADNPSLSMGSGAKMTACVWAKIDSKNTTLVQEFISKGSTSGTWEYFLRYDGRIDRFAYLITPNGSTLTEVRANTFGSPVIGQWYFVCGGYDGANTWVSVNAGPRDTVANTTGIFDGTAEVRIGGNSGNHSYLDGALDEAVLYKRSLTNSEVTWLYNNGSGRIYADLTANTAGWYLNNYTYSTTEPHAVTAVNRVNFTDTFAYDENGNMTCRTESGVTYKQSYNAENRISAVHKMSGNCDTGTALESWTFLYDGDGVRVSTAHFTAGNTNPDSFTRYFFGGALETSGTNVKKYYSFAGQTVAMKDASGFKYFLTDHLGSTSVVLDANGGILEQQRYLPFGQPRQLQTFTAIASTDFTYTGQRELDSGMGGIMDYKARFYSPYINHFLQPDTIIPSLANPQSWNRYSYVGNNPIGYSDPTGHMRVADGSTQDRLKKSLVDSYVPVPSKTDPCINTKCDLHDRHEFLRERLQITLPMESGATVNLPAYYGDYPGDTNVPYIPTVSSGIRGPIPPNPCKGGGSTGSTICGISILNDLLLLIFPPQHNSNSNFSLTFTVEYYKSLEMRSITVSDMQYANRGKESILASVLVGDESFHADNIYMSTDGSYSPTQKSAGQFDGSNPLTVNVNILAIIDTPNGAGSIPFIYNKTLPAVP